jgi:hypothetical protein
VDFILQFKCLTLEDKYLFETYTNKHNILSYEYTFPSLYLWRKLCNVKYAILDDALIINKQEEFKGAFFMQPLGYKKEKLSGIIKKLIEIRKEYPSKYLFGDVNEEFINDIIEYTDFNISSIKDIDDSEYIYSTKDLIELSGKKFHAKKNHYNKFLKNYNYEVKEINTPKIKNDCMELLKRWHSVKEEVDKELVMETDAINDVLCKLDILKLKTIAVYASSKNIDNADSNITDESSLGASKLALDNKNVNNKIIAFSIGEKYANDTMANILVEKADIDYEGIYAFINREFLIRHFSETQFVNRQEDTGSEGLRKSKQSYNPIRMEEKYLLNLS